LEPGSPFLGTGPFLPLEFFGGRSSIFVERLAEVCVINRRSFLKAGAAAGTLAALTDPLSGTAHAAAGLRAAAGDVAWLKTLRRIGQTNITEHDPAVMDVEGWANYWARVKAGAVFVSVTGILAYYPTQVPFHRKGKYLGDRDFFGELNAAARKRGMRTIARMSPDLNWGDALAAHPEWFMRDEQGQGAGDADTPELFQTCMFTGYMTDYMPAIMREINARYDVDGFYMNGWPMFNLPVCYCNDVPEAAAAEDARVLGEIQRSRDGAVEAVRRDRKGEERGGVLFREYGRRHPCHAESGPGGRGGAVVPGR
jgi:hypothetical protein